MDYLSGSFNSKKKPLAGANAVQGELVTPTPANYTQPKALPNQTFIDGQVSRPSLAGTQPAITAANPVNSSATQSLTKMAQKPALPPYQPAVNPVNQYGEMPANKPPVGNVGGSVSATPPATRLAGGVSKLAAAMPAIQAGMNASAIMNQEANFAQNIHAGSIADPNFGKEVLGDTANQFSRTQTPAPKLSTGVIGVGRAGTQPVPDQYINSRAGQSLNPAYTQYAANHPQKPAVAPANQATQPLRDVKVPAFSTPTNPVANVNPMDSRPAPQQYAPKLAGTQPKIPASMNDVTSGTGYIKGGSGAFKDGVGFTQGQGGVLSLSNGKTIDPNQPTYRTADGKGTITSNARPTLSGLSKQLDTDVATRLQQQTANGAITASRGNQIQSQYNQDTAPLAQQPQIAMQRMAAQGNIPAAQQLTQQQQVEGQNAVQNRQLANAEKTTDHAINNPIQLLSEHKAKLEMLAASKDPAEAEQGRQGLAQIAALTPTTLIPVSHKEKDAMGNVIEDTDLRNPYTGLAPNPKSKNAPVDANGKPIMEGDIVTGADGKKYKNVRGQKVAVD